jgi:hypothetical protein
MTITITIIIIIIVIIIWFARKLIGIPGKP